MKERVLLKEHKFTTCRCRYVKNKLDETAHTTYSTYTA